MDDARPAALAGIRVADFTWAWAGAYATSLLAFFGAEVIKIESAERLDHTRVMSLTTGQRFQGIDSSTIFNDINLNKFSVRLNLTRPEAREIARKIVAISDVAAQNMRPGVMERLGLGYEDLRLVKPDIIMLSSSALGSTGPLRSYVGYAPVFAALGGLAEVTGSPNGPPVPLSGSVDLRSATMSAFAVLAALNQRARTGLGQHIDVSSVEVVSSLIGHLFTDYELTGKAARRRGNDEPSFAPHNSYRCRSGWVTIAVGSDEEWSAFCTAIGSPEWTRDRRFASQMQRWKSRRALDRHVETWTREREADEVAGALQRAGVAATPSWGPESISHDEHLQARGYFDEVQHPVLGKRRVVGPPWKLSKTPARISRPAPLLGEHHDYVLGELLGFSSAAIRDLEADGIVY